MNDSNRRQIDDHDEQITNDINLAEEIAAITGRDGRAAEALSFYLLALAEDTQYDRDSLRGTIVRSVEFAFLYTDAYQAALELFMREKRGLIYGADTEAGLIQGILRSNSQSFDDV